MTATTDAPPQLPEVAYYYPNATWRFGSSGFIKNLLLFFDGVGLLLPEHLRDKPFAQDPDLAPALRDHGLLHLLTPEEIIDKAITERLAESVSEILVTGALDHLARDGSAFHELSYSRLGAYGDVGLAQMLYEELARRGLARPTSDGYSIPMHPIARSLILVLLAQILRANGDKVGLALSPVTDRPDVLGALQQLLSIPSIPTAGHVVAFDLESVGVDLSNVPVDRVFTFRERFGEEHKRYARDVRAFVRILGVLSCEERAEAYTDRREELQFRAKELTREQESYWRKPATFFLSLLGAMAGLGGSGGFGALFSVGGAFAAFGPKPFEGVGPHSYLFRSRRLHA